MGPLPKRRHSTGRGGRRYKNIKQEVEHLLTCQNCGAKKLSHRVCPACGTYSASEAKKTETKSKKQAK
ncbi:MAG TPA: 50S ribosomal protein L32 [Candidatus Pacebacteria bacterium]|nr:50S ribosomal protein L32 [Candidatus Paceibacterota bacterium]HCR11196.1 50S ribosomal protein L32 [Candidatus Paceibacterota bacterium]HCR92780.1 50S ribosomal protein L32 [Candidatus Paceibacterota bacterium]